MPAEAGEPGKPGKDAQESGKPGGPGGPGGKGGEGQPPGSGGPGGAGGTGGDAEGFQAWWVRYAGSVAFVALAIVTAGGFFYVQSGPATDKACERSRDTREVVLDELEYQQTLPNTARRDSALERAQRKIPPIDCGGVGLVP